MTSNWDTSMVEGRFFDETIRLREALAREQGALLETKKREAELILDFNAAKNEIRILSDDRDDLLEYIIAFHRSDESRADCQGCGGLGFINVDTNLPGGTTNHGFEQPTFPEQAICEDCRTSGKTW